VLFLEKGVPEQPFYFFSNDMLPIGLQHAYVSKSFFSQVTSWYWNRSNSRIQIHIPCFALRLAKLELEAVTIQVSLFWNDMLPIGLQHADVSKSVFFLKRHHGTGIVLISGYKYISPVLLNVLLS
jgi:hypothetical protein